MDIIFGTYSTDELKLLHHRANRQGVQHQHALSPADPVPNAPVTLSVLVGADTAFDHLVCYYTTAAEPPSGRYGISDNSRVVPFTPVETVWDTLIWGYLVRWEATLPGQPDGTIVQYRIGSWRDGEPEYFADFPDAQTIVETATDAHFRQQTNDLSAAQAAASGQVFAYSVDTITPPAWAYDAVIYQILVDRFYPGDGHDWLQTEVLDRPMGGTLWGVRDKLGYIADLGMNCIWLSPSWISYSIHGYDVIDYSRTADFLGGDAGLHAVIEAAHRLNIRVLLDLPCNHLSNHNAYFEEAGGDPTSRYRDWFTFDDSPIGYKCFFNVPTMPQVNLANPEARDWMVNIGRYWLREFDVDGYRLDYANGPGPDFWTYFSTACKAEKADSFCFGEVVDSPQAQQHYIGRLDGCLDFYLEEQLRATFGWKTQTVADFERNAARHQKHDAAHFLLPTFIDNHDMNRFLHIARGDKVALRAALKRQFSLPNPPILYYGNEVGLSHTRGTRELGLEAGRVPMLWGDQQDRDLLADVAAIIHARRAASVERTRSGSSA